MIAFGFIVRLLKALFYLMLFGISTVGIAYLLTWGLRLSWDIFERNFQDTARWAKRKFHILKPWRCVTVPFITLMLFACMIITAIYIFAVGQSAQGSIIK